MVLHILEFVCLLAVSVVCFWLFGTPFEALLSYVVRNGGAIPRCGGVFMFAIAVVLFNFVSFSIDHQKLVTDVEKWQLSRLRDESNVTWTLNMFEMDLGTHRDICLNGTNPPQNKTWPWYIDHPDPPPNPVLDKVDVKFLALYFPQWYPSPVNDNLDDWRYFQNPNFTMNRNSVFMSRPLNNIYYDPRCLEQRRTQAALAKKYLLDGFIYYFYFPENEWFLSDVNKQMLLDGEPDTDFALYWVNEEFAGKESVYDEAELLANVLLPFVTHPRYITINGRPILYVYVATDVPTEYIHKLQDTLIEKGAPKLYIIASIQLWRNQVSKIEFADAYAEFPPNTGNGDFYGYHKWDHVDDYQLGMSLNFDNTPRVSKGNPEGLPHALTKNRTLPAHQPTPKEFRERCISRVRAWYNQTKSEKAVLFFAWNEWSEQAALEPSDIYGYEYLEALRDCRLSTSNLNEMPPLNDTSSLR
ncbi:Glycosyltransferase WbsX [Fragilaria crotonensis]|nr:Glycosyltransferase WbsX [Fragilaria crotonensis]